MGHPLTADDAECEQAEKVELIKKLMELCGIDPSELNLN
jgi:hypothetical protein